MHHLDLIIEFICFAITAFSAYRLGRLHERKALNTVPRVLLDYAAERIEELELRNRELAGKLFAARARVKELAAEVARWRSGDEITYEANEKRLASEARINQLEAKLAEHGICPSCDDPCVPLVVSGCTCEGSDTHKHTYHYAPQVAPSCELSTSPEPTQGVDPVAAYAAVAGVSVPAFVGLAVSAPIAIGAASVSTAPAQFLTAASPEERLVAVYRELLELEADPVVTGATQQGDRWNFGAIHRAIDAMSEICGPILARGKAVAP